jgi:phage tail sheath gpL-like
MPINTGIPSNLRRPGSFHVFDVTSASKGFVPINRRVALVGVKSAAGTQANLTPVQLFSESDGDGYFGPGSELALMARWAFKGASHYVAKYGGGQPQIWAVSIADPAGTAQTYTVTITGTATASGDIVLLVAGRLIRVGVSSGDVQNTIATKVTDAIKAYGYQNLPVTSATATNVATLTAVQTGVNGIDIKVAKLQDVAGVTTTVAAGATGAGTYSLTAALDTLRDKTYHSVAVAVHTSTTVDQLQTHLDNVGAAGEKKWAMGFVAETGTLSTGTTLAASANQKEVVVASMENCPNTPGEIAALLATTVECEADVALSFDGVELPLYLPPNLGDVYTITEQETALAAGTTPLVVNDQLDKVKVVRLVTTLTTINSAPFENLLDISNVRVLFFMATQIDAAWLTQFQRAKKNARTIKRVRSVTIDLLRKGEELEFLQNVEAHLDEVVVETDPVVKTRLNVLIPQSVVPNLHQLVGKHVLHVE